MENPLRRPSFSYLVAELEGMEPITEEGHELEGGRDGAMCGQDGGQEEYVKLSNVPLYQLHIEATETPSGEGNGSGDVAMISHSHDDNQEERVSISALSSNQPHIEEAVPVTNCKL